MQQARTESEPTWVSDVLDFWFALAPEAWFEKSDALDHECRSRFQSTYETLAAQSAEQIAITPRQALAALIVLDQFSRNIFRGLPRAFAADPLARDVSRLVVARGWDKSLTKNERLFVYLPFEHSEDMSDQDRSIALFTALEDDFYLKFAVAHRDIIVRFGRFPHRNALLGRPSTPDEVAFLQEPGSSF